MRILISAISAGILVMATLAGSPAAGQDLPACNTELMARHGNEITMGLQQLSDMAGKKLRAAGSNFSDLKLAAGHGNRLTISGKKNGNAISISGPLHPMSSGAVKLHADHIVKNGDHDKGLMDFFGKDLADYAHFNKTQILSAQGNNLLIHPDPLLNVSGDVTGVWLRDSKITLKFRSQPCR